MKEKWQQSTKEVSDAGLCGNAGQEIWKQYPM